jgi:hypothetical protein
MVGGLILNFLIHAAENLGDELPPEARVPHVLIIDEAENFIGEDLRMAFPELRKFKFCVVAVFQDLSCLRKGDLDLQGKVISQCGLQITFQQGNPDDFEYLAKAFGYGSLDLTPLLVDTVLPDGYEWADTESVSVGESESRSESHSTSLTRSESRTQTRMTSESIQRSVAEALSESTTEGTSLSRTSGVGLSWSQGETHTDGVSTSVQVSAQDGRSHTETRSESDSLGRSQQKGTSEAQGQNRAAGESIQRRAASMFDEHRTQTASDSTSRQSSASETSGTNESHSTTEGQSDSVTRTDGFTQGQSVSETDGVSASRGLTLSGAVTAGESAGETRGRTRTEGQSVGRTTGTSEGMSEGTAAGESRGESTGHATSRTRTTGKTPLSRSRIVTRPTGSLVRSVADQIAAVANVLASLPDRVVMVKCRGMGAPFLVQVHEVLDAYEDAGKTRPRAWKEAELRAYIAAVEAAHPYYFTPPPGREDRVARFLTDAPDRPLVVDAGGCRCGADAGRAAPPRPAGASGFIDD